MVHKQAVKKTKKLVNSLIQSSSNYFGVDLRYFISGGFWTSIPVGTEALVNIIIAMVFTRVVTVEVYGEFRFFLSILFTLLIFSLPGIGTAVVRSVSKGFDRSLVDGVKSRVIFSFLGSLAFVITAGYFYYIQMQGLMYIFLATAVIFPFFYSYRTFSEYLLGKEEFQRQSKYATIQLIVVSAFFLASIVLSRNLFIIVLTYLLAWSISSIIVYVLVKYQHKAAIKKSKKDKSLFSYGFNLSLMDLVPFAASNIDKILVTYFLGFKMLAIYAIALTIAEQNKISIKPLLRILLPRLSRQKDTKLTFQSLKKKLLYFVGFSLLTCIAGIILAPIIMPIMFPESYAASIFYAQLLFAGFIFTLPSIVFRNFLFSQKSVKSLYKGAIYPAVFKIILLAVLLPLYGVYGAIVAVMLSNYSMFGVLYYMSRKEAYSAR